ncbi:MAG: hypothetical protein AAFV53_04690 [Myxococcota bacterium]
MAEITIRLRYNLETGKKDLLIDYHSDDDALPMEHEQDHRAIVADLIGKGVLSEADVGDVVVRRLSPESTPAREGVAAPAPELSEDQS